MKHNSPRFGAPRTVAGCPCTSEPDYRQARRFRRPVGDCPICRSPMMDNPSCASLPTVCEGQRRLPQRLCTALPHCSERSPMSWQWSPEGKPTVQGCICSRVQDHSPGRSASYCRRNCSTRLRFTPRSNRHQGHRDSERTSIVLLSGPKRSSMSSTKPSGDRHSACTRPSVADTTLVRGMSASRASSLRMAAAGLPRMRNGSILCRGGASARLHTHVKRNLGHGCRSCAIAEHPLYPPSHGTPGTGCPQRDSGLHRRGGRKVLRTICLASWGKSGLRLPPRQSCTWSSLNHTVADLQAGAGDRSGQSIAEWRLGGRSHDPGIGRDGQNPIPACVDDWKGSAPNTRD